MEPGWIREQWRWVSYAVPDTGSPGNERHGDDYLLPFSTSLRATNCSSTFVGSSASATSFRSSRTP